MSSRGIDYQVWLGGARVSLFAGDRNIRAFGRASISSAFFRMYGLYRICDSLCIQYLSRRALVFVRRTQQLGAGEVEGLSVQNFTLGILPEGTT